MSTKRRIFLVMPLLALALCWGQPAVAQFVCAMSGEVSTSCCCASAASDGCTTIARDCLCCEVSVSEAAPLTNQSASPVVHVPAIAAPMAIASHAIAVTTSESPLPSFDIPARGSPPLFVLNQSFRC